MGTDKKTLPERISSLEKSVEENGKTMWRIFEAIYGNGKPGLISEFQLLRQSVQEHHKSVEQLQIRSHSDWKWIITTGLSLLALVITIILK